MPNKILFCNYLHLFDYFKIWLPRWGGASSAPQLGAPPAALAATKAGAWLQPSQEGSVGAPSGAQGPGPGGPGGPRGSLRGQEGAPPSAREIAPGAGRPLRPVLSTKAPGMRVAELPPRQPGLCWPRAASTGRRTRGRQVGAEGEAAPRRELRAPAGTTACPPPGTRTCTRTSCPAPRSPLAVSHLPSPMALLSAAGCCGAGPEEGPRPPSRRPAGQDTRGTGRGGA